MKLTIVFASVSLVVAAWIATARAGGHAQPMDPSALARLELKVQELGERLDRQGDERDAGALERPRQPAPTAVDAHVAPATAPSVSTEVSAAASRQTLETAVQELLAVGQWSPEGRAIWHELAQAGLLDEAVAWFEQRALLDPTNADAQADLGDAIAQKSHSASNAIEQIELARRADAAYDAALALDPEHWRARFNKAVSYTFWPDVLGKQPAAIEHLEQLLGQQEHLAPQPGYEQTYLYLGNLYAQAGDPVKAKETWQLGLQHFPGDPALLAALGL